MQMDLQELSNEQLDDLKMEFGEIFMKNIVSMISNMDTISKVNTQSDTLLNETCPPLASLLLRVRCIQDRIASELMIPFSVPEDMEGNKELISSRIINCLRDGLGRYVHKPKEVLNTLFGLIEALDPEYQCEAIQCLTALPDSEHVKISESLMKLFYESSSYLKAVLEALRVLTLPKVAAVKIRTAIEERFDQFSEEEIPLAVRYLLHNCENMDRARACLSKVKEVVSLSNPQLHSTPSSFDLEFQLSSDASSIGGSQTGKTNTLLLAEIILNCLSMYKQVAEAAVELVQGEGEVESHKLSDFHFLVLLLLIKISTRRKQATVIMFQLIVDGCLSSNLVWKFLHDLPELTEYFKTELTDLAFSPVV